MELTVFPQTRRDVEKMSKEAVTSFHGVLKANSQFVPQLKPDVKSELTKRFGKLGMPGEATPAAPSLLGRVNWKYVGLGTLAIAIIAGGIFVVPPLLAQRSLENRITIADQNLARIELDLSYADGNVTALNQTLITQQSAYDALKLQLEDARSSATDLNGQLQLAIATQTPLQAQYDALGTVSATLASDLLTANKNVDRLTPLVRKAETKANGLETNLEKTDFEALKQSATKARSEADKFDPELNDQLQNAIEKAERLEKQVKDYNTDEALESDSETKSFKALEQSAQKARSEVDRFNSELKDAVKNAEQLEGEISDYETLKQSATKARSEASELRRELETAQALATSLQETSTLVSELGTATDEVNRLTSLSQKAGATLANFGDGVDRSNVESATIAFDNALQKKEGLTLQKQEVENLLAELRA